MPTLPLPSGSAPVDGGDLPVSSSDDVLAAFPKFMRRSASALVRDGLVAAITAMCLEYQSRSSFAAAQSDVLRAEGEALKAFGEPLDIFKADGEDDESYRLRILGIPSLVTPAAILAAVNAILAPYTSIAAQYSESIGDRWYVGGGGAKDWHSFVWAGARSRSPVYLDRYYEDDAAQNGGVSRAQSNPGGARAYRDCVGRHFLLRVPDITRINTIGCFPLVRASYPNPLTSPAQAPGWFVGKGVSANNTTFSRKTGATADTVYGAIANTINRIKGQSIRWVLLADPKLGN